MYGHPFLTALGWLTIASKIIIHNAGKIISQTQKRTLLIRLSLKYKVIDIEEQRRLRLLNHVRELKYNFVNRYKEK